MAVSSKTNHKKKIKVKIKLSWKNIFLYGFLIAFTLFMFVGLSSPLEEHKQVPLSDIVLDVKKDNVKQIVVLDRKITAHRKNGEIVQSVKEPGASVYQLFKDAGANLDKTKVVVKDDTGVTCQA